MRPLHAGTRTVLAAVLLLGLAGPLPAGGETGVSLDPTLMLPIPYLLPDPCDPLYGDADGDGWADRCECGDMDGNGWVDTTDARLIQRCAIHDIPCTGLCDVTGDGLCNTSDARMVQRYAVQDLPKHALQCEPRKRCCDPALEPGTGDNPFCFEGATCCADGRWACNQGDGTPSCLPGLACPDRCAPVLCQLFCPFGFKTDADGCPICECDDPPRCCDPDDAPGVGGNPFCFEGASCCRDGTWSCNQADGTPSCRIGPVCDPGRCCDPDAEPGVGGNPFCIEGAACCADGRWACNQGDGTLSCDAVGRVCPKPCDPVLCEIFCPFGFKTGPDGCEICACKELPHCCDPADEPGVGGNPFCIEGATCCQTGEWACNRGDGSPSCASVGRVCEACCDPAKQPGVGGNPFCFEGASCCANGEWACNQGDGTPSCDLLGHVCRPDRCRDNGDCGAFEFCAKPPGQCDEIGRCERRPEVCPLFLDPVCGCDRRTYGNACEAHAAGVSIAHEGRCRPAVCDRDSDCAPNEFCDVEACGALDVSPAGVCVEKPEACPRVYEPVCGCDGRTYGNDCERRAAGVWKQHDGPCKPICGGIAGFVCPEPEQICVFPPGTCNIVDNLGTCADRPEFCPAVYLPVCGCDGKTYGNACEALRAGTQVDHKGPCEKRCESNGDCPEGQICFPPTRLCQEPCQINCLVPDPVCGQDGVTYVCGELDAHCHGTEIAHEGECGCVCPEVYDPVCGVDGVTYGNACEARCAAVDIAHRGPCQEE